MPLTVMTLMRRKYRAFGDRHRLMTRPSNRLNKVLSGFPSYSSVTALK